MTDGSGRTGISDVTEAPGSSFQPEQGLIGLQQSQCARQSGLMGIAIGAAGAGHRFLNTKAVGRSIHSGVLFGCAGAAIAFASCRYPSWQKQRQHREEAESQLATREELERQFEAFDSQRPDSEA